MLFASNRKLHYIVFCGKCNKIIYEHTMYVPTGWREFPLSLVLEAWTYNPVITGSNPELPSPVRLSQKHLQSFSEMNQSWNSAYASAYIGALVSGMELQNGASCHFVVCNQVQVQIWLFQTLKWQKTRDVALPIWISSSTKFKKVTYKWSFRVHVHVSLVL